ncbi:MAG: hypothetical protein JXA03_11815 [Bacteroidales bacterium]|nr:hypothetical protein [Bacteroidales bacterium]
MQKIIKIETDDDYRDALNRFIELCKTQKTNDDLNELMLLTSMMEKYERANCGEN